jgi:hypothetical protein
MERFHVQQELSGSRHAKTEPSTGSYARLVAAVRYQVTAIILSIHYIIHHRKAAQCILIKSSAIGSVSHLIQLLLHNLPDARHLPFSSSHSSTQLCSAVLITTTTTSSTTNSSSSITQLSLQ